MTNEPLIFYRGEVECDRRDMTREQGIEFHKARKDDLGEEADRHLLRDFNKDRAEDQQADGFSFGSLNVRLSKL